MKPHARTQDLLLSFQYLRESKCSLNLVELYLGRDKNASMLLIVRWRVQEAESKLIGNKLQYHFFAVQRKVALVKSIKTAASESFV